MQPRAVCSRKQSKTQGKSKVPMREQDLAVRRTAASEERDTPLGPEAQARCQEQSA